jgi:ABC-type glycerol-3-phosphate transport system substrate-binding protein
MIGTAPTTSANETSAVSVGTATITATVAPTITVPEAVTIRFATYDEGRDAYTALTKQFNKTHPHINVVLVSLDSTLNGILDSSGNHPTESNTSVLRRVVSVADAIPGNNSFTNNTVGTPFTLNLKPFMDADSSFDPYDFYYGILDRYMVDDRIYLLPRSINMPLLAYNQNLFKDANIPNPSQNWTYGNVLATATKLTKKDNDTITRYGLYDTKNAFIYLLKEAGVDIYTLNKSNINAKAPNIVKALNKYADLVHRGVIYAQPHTDQSTASQDTTATSGDPDHMILAGKIAIWSEEALHVQRAPAPLLSAAQFNHYFKINGNPKSTGYMISSGTQNPNETWTFIEWLSRQPLNTPLRSNPQGYVNTRKSVDVQQSADGVVDKQYQSAYESTVADLPPVTSPVNSDSQDFPIVAIILGSTDLLFSNPPLTSEEIVNQSIQIIQSTNEHPIQVGQVPLQTCDLS